MVPMKIPYTKLPPWTIHNHSFIDKLTFLRKDNTSNASYQQTFLNIVTPFKQSGWNLLFTDGTKQNSGVAFAITTDTGLTLSHGLLPQYANIFEAELQGIISALNLAKRGNNKTIICTDSQSVFKAARNIHYGTGPLYHLQQLLIELSPNVKLMWIPGHSGILGNEHADKAAKFALKSCLYTYNPFGTTSIKKLYSTALKSHLHSNWQHYQHEYKEVNPSGIAIALPSTTSISMNRCYVRLRLGHALLTHEHHLTRSPHPTCSFCNTANLSIRHILLQCPATAAIRTRTFDDAHPLNILSNPSESNIILISKFLKALDIFHLI